MRTALVGAVLLLSAHAVAAQELSWSELGRLEIPLFGESVNNGDIFGLSPQDTLLEGTRLYLPTGTFDGLILVDLSDPSSPSLLSHYTGIDSREVAASGNMIYSVDGNRFDIVDASDPLRLESLGFLQVNSGSGAAATGVAVSGTTAFIAGGGPFLATFPALQAIDVSDSTMPKLLGSSVESGGADVTLSGSIAYVPSYDDGLRIYDVSSPSTIKLLGSTGTLGTATKVRLQQGIAYVYNAGELSYGGSSSSLAILDVSDPTRPFILHLLAIPNELAGGGGRYQGIRVAGNRAYVSQGGGVVAIDVSNPSSPAILGWFGPNVYTGGVEVIGENLAIADLVGIVVVPEPGDALGALLALVALAALALSRKHVARASWLHGVGLALIVTHLAAAMPAAAQDLPWTEVGTLEIPLFASTFPQRTALGGNRLYVPCGANGEDGIVVVDLTDPTQPAIGSQYTDVNSVRVAVSGNTLYSVSLNDLDLLDATDPRRLVPLGHVPLNPSGLGEAAVAIAAVDSVAFVSGGGPGLGGFPAVQAIDVSDPSSPKLLGAAAESGGADVAVSGGRAYVASYDLGIRIYDVSSPSSIRLMGSTGTLGRATGVAIQGDIAFVYNDAQGFLGVDAAGASIAILDVTDSARPFVLKVLVLPSDLGGINGEFQLIGDRLYVAGGLGLDVIDVSIPSKPVFLGTIESNSTAGVEILGERLVVTDSSGVVVVPEPPEMAGGVGALLLMAAFFARWNRRSLV
jgi:hypothetical protein